MLSSIYMSLFGPNFFAFFPISYTDYSVAPPVCYTCASEYVDRIEVSSPHSLLGQSLRGECRQPVCSLHPKRS